MLPQSYTFSRGLCLIHFLKFGLIDNQRYQVALFRYITWADEVSHLVRGKKVLGNMKYLIEVSLTSSGSGRNL